MTKGIQKEHKLAHARGYASFSLAPYFTTGLTSMLPIKAPWVDTMGITEKGQLLYNPEWIETMGVAPLSGMLIHQLMHILKRHADRRKEMGIPKDRPELLEVWNLAACLECNEDIREAGWPLPDDAPTPESLGLPPNKTAGFYYHEIRNNMVEGPAPPKCQCCSGSGNPHPEEEEQLGGEGEGDEENPEHSPMAMEGIRKSVAQSIREAHEKGQGTVPAGMLRWAEFQLRPAKISWQDKLFRATHQAVAWVEGSVDYGYDRLSRRQYLFGQPGPGVPILARMRAPVPTIMIAVDTSGSMGKRDLEDALTEARAILAQAGGRVLFVACDAKTYGVTEVNDVAAMTKLLKGGGGTDFRPVFELIKEHRPNVLIFATDGYGPAPAKPPVGCHTIWLLIGGAKAPADWGQAIVYERDDEAA